MNNIDRVNKRHSSENKTTPNIKNAFAASNYAFFVIFSHFSKNILLYKNYIYLCNVYSI
jgi:hypothetical protein